MAQRTERIVGYVTIKRKEQLDRLCETRNTSLSALINEALSDLLQDVLGGGES
jgi:hypothetical protein